MIRFEFISYSSFIAAFLDEIFLLFALCREFDPSRASVFISVKEKSQSKKRIIALTN